jgi:G3E family GTPase
MAKPVVVVTGFLGCGKTSFLRHLLPLCGEVGVHPLLIINEVGDVDVDGELLADLHAEQARLVGGCVCCTLQGQLAQTLFDALERDAGDIIIIECSGLSNPIDVLATLATPALVREVAVSHIICLLDAVRAKPMLSVVELAKSQVSAADIVVLNKADKVDDEQRAIVEDLARGLAPDADLRWASYGDIGAEALARILTDPAPLRASCGCGHDHCDHAHHHHAHALPASFCTVAVVLPEMLERAAMEAILANLPENVIRAKGFCCLRHEGWQVIHKVYDSAELTPFPEAVPSSGAILVCIGQRLDADAILRLIERTAATPSIG